uniref:Uncharacterized protein n=1 Tax=viral metagenome TaxID=1070528 RepID=A0A6C0FDD4_9ZZZZ|tara:strand:+ start:7450 stop:7665 length:216 start_codon:yes stop_codon:yes gene_type:complete
MDIYENVKGYFEKRVNINLANRRIAEELKIKRKAVKWAMLTLRKEKAIRKVKGREVGTGKSKVGVYCYNNM